MTLLPLLSFLAANTGLAGVDNDRSAPLWGSVPIRTAEPVLFLRQNTGDPPKGILLFEPRRLLRAYAANRSAEYPVSDFRITGREIIYSGETSIPALYEDELSVDEKTPNSIGHHLDGKRYLLYRSGRFFHDQQICFDYETNEVWTGPAPNFSPDVLPRFHKKLKEGDPVSLVFLGDSISAGGDASVRIKAPPLLPPYPEQFAARIRTTTQSEVTFHNLSKGGQSSPWGVSQATSAASLSPDLLVIAFGMNDASWSAIPAPSYAANIRAIIDTVRRTSPQTEYVVVSPMTPNPLWNRDRPALRAAYHKELRAMAAPQVAFCDVHSPWLYLTTRKHYLSLSGNGINHPNDFGHRLYADVLTQTVLGPSAWDPR